MPVPTAFRAAFSLKNATGSHDTIIEDCYHFSRLRLERLPEISDIQHCRKQTNVLMGVGIHHNLLQLVAKLSAWSGQFNGLCKMHRHFLLGNPIVNLFLPA